MPLRPILLALTSATVLVAAASSQPSASTHPTLMTAKDRVPWSNLAELERFAEAGNLKACAQFGEQLARGDGIGQNVPRALTFLERAARGGIGSAMFRLGMIYDDGQGVPKDRARAVEYFRAAAAAGEAEGFFNVGAAYVGAHGVKRDYAEGLAWIILAAKRGAGGDNEDAVRARIKRLRHPEWITAAETRAPEIERELAATTPAALLPAPADTSLAPATATSSVATPIPLIKPDAPALPPPTLPTP